MWVTHLNVFFCFLLEINAHNTTWWPCNLPCSPSSLGRFVLLNATLCQQIHCPQTNNWSVKKHRPTKWQFRMNILIVYTLHSKVIQLVCFWQSSSVPFSIHKQQESSTQVSNDCWVPHSCHFRVWNDLSPKKLLNSKHSHSLVVSSQITGWVKGVVCSVTSVPFHSLIWPMTMSVFGDMSVMDPCFMRETNRPNW